MGDGGVKCPIMTAQVENRVAAVFTAYFPKPEFEANIRQILPQVGVVIVVDNTDRIPYFELDLPGLLIIRNEQNLGLGGALNNGIRKAIELGFEQVLLLDQDTLPDADIVEKLLDIRNRARKTEKIGCVMANGRISGTNRFCVNTDSWPNDFGFIRTLMIAGMLLDTQVFLDAGPLREDFFMDAVDTEYAFRLRYMGYQLKLSKHPLMTHVPGTGRSARFFHRTVLLMDHPPHRYFRMIRNHLYVVRLYPLSISGYLIFGHFKWLVKTMLFESQRWEIFKVVIRATVAGLMPFSQKDLGVRGIH